MSRAGDGLGHLIKKSSELLLNVRTVQCCLTSIDVWLHCDQKPWGRFSVDLLGNLLHAGPAAWSCHCLMFGLLSKASHPLDIALRLAVWSSPTSILECKLHKQ